MKDCSRQRSCRYIFRIAAIAAVCLLLTVSCTTTKKAVKAIRFSNNLIKKVAVVPIGNRTFLSDAEVEEIFGTRFWNRLEKSCSNTVLLKPFTPSFPKGLTDLPKNQATDRIDNMAIAQLGERYGLNAVARATLIDISVTEKKSGLLFLKREKYLATIQVHLLAYSTETGAKILDKTFRDEMTVDGPEYDAIEAGAGGGLFEVRERLENLAKASANMLGSAINRQPWRGYIVSMNGVQATLSTGREAGLKPGDMLVIHDRGDVIEGRYGERFFIPGKNIGELRVVNVFIGKAEVEILSGLGAVRPGSVVRLP